MALWVLRCVSVLYVCVVCLYIVHESAIDLHDLFRDTSLGTLYTVRVVGDRSVDVNVICVCVCEIYYFFTLNVKTFPKSDLFSPFFTPNCLFLPN